MIETVEARAAENKPPRIPGLRRLVNGAERHPWLALTLLLLVIAAFNLATLLRYPAPYVDEAWAANRAWGMLQTGHAFGTMDAGVFQQFPGYWTYMPWLGTAIHAVAIRLLGLSLLTMRLTSLFFGLLLLVAVFAIAHRLVGLMAALLAVLLTAFSSSFAYTSHVGRHDVIVAALGYGAVALYVANRSSRFSVGTFFNGLVVGLAVGATFDIHPNGIILPPVIVALYLLDFGWSTPRIVHFWGFVVGIASGVAFFLAMHVLQYPETYFALASPAYGVWRQPPLLTWNPMIWLQSIVDTARVLVVALDFQALVLIVAVVYLLRRRTASDKRLLVLLAAVALVFAAVIRFKALRYSVLVSPAADLLLASFLVQIPPRPWTAAQRVKIELVAIPLALSVLLSAVLVFNGAPYDDYQVAIAHVQAATSPGASIMGPQTFWFGVTKDTYYSWEQLAYYPKYAPGSTLDDAFQDLRPDYLILDSQTDNFIVDDRTTLDPSFWFAYVPKTDLDHYLSAHANLVDSFENKTYGDVRIYRIDWSGGKDGR